jgi:hypothetical protein
LALRGSFPVKPNRQIDSLDFRPLLDANASDGEGIGLLFARIQGCSLHCEMGPVVVVGAALHRRVAALAQEFEMPLIACPECGRQISTAAEACPQCGHPSQPATRPATGPTCHACSLPATTRCQRCGGLSCAQHLQNIYVPHGQGGAYELRCPNCYDSAMVRKIISWTIGGSILLLIILFLIMVGFV